jgi:HD-like signal output (HDOD) protein
MVLRLANSAYYGGAMNRITSVSMAVARVGLREISRIGTCLAVMKTFEHIGGRLDRQAFWKHSLLVAMGTRLFRRHSRVVNTLSEDDVYVAGLLHDIGALIVDEYFPPFFEKLGALAAERGIAHAELEQRALDLDHGGIGGMLLRRWNLPEPTVQAVAWHHQPDKADPEFRALSQTVHLADFLCINIGVGVEIDGMVAYVSEAAWTDLEVAKSDIPVLINELVQESLRCDLFLRTGAGETEE